MTYEWKRCDVWSVMKISFLMCGVGGFILGLFYAIVLTLIGGILNMVGGSEFEEISGLFSGPFWFFLAFVMAFVYAVLGSIIAAILTWLYNFFARLVGGIKVTLDPESEAETSAQLIEASSTLAQKSPQSSPLNRESES